MRDPKYDEFRVIVSEVMKLSNLSFILALYKVLDKWTAEAIEKEGITLACHAGCGFCCHQLVTCTGLEWAAIADFLKDLPEKRRYWLKKRIAILLVEWRQYRQKKFKINTEGVLSAKNPLDDWQGRSCPFLNDQQTCDIYPVRPIDCRTMTSTLACSDWENTPGVRRMRFPWEQSANNWILEINGMKVYYFLDLLYESPHLL